MAAALRLAVALLLASPAAAAPQRIVSTNPCVDAILIEVADARQIAAISHFSQDADATSIPLRIARRFRATSGTAEEIVALRPDLVLAGAHEAPATIAALKRLGVRVELFGVADSVAASRAQVAAIARAAGRPQRGAALIARIDGAVAAARAGAGPGPPPAALIWQGEGLVPGRGTLADELLRIAGFRNASADHGLAMWDVLPLEPLAARPPRLLFADPRNDGRISGHPTLQRLAGRMRIAPFHERLISCAGPTIIPALARLSAARASL